MKKTELLNDQISAVIATMGHGDTLVIGDAGLPIPPGTRRIDLALSRGLPGFLDTLRAVLSELAVQKAVVATEMASVSPALYAETVRRLDGVAIETTPHETLKALSGRAVAVIRTGEFTPYANVILESGVVF